VKVAPAHVFRRTPAETLFVTKEERITMQCEHASRVAVAAVLSAAVVGVGPAAGQTTPQAAPVNSELPRITGTPRVGQVLTAQNGTWQNDPTSFRYQWQRCGSRGGSCANLVGATERTHTVVPADAGRTMRVRVTAVNADGATNARSAPTDVVTSGAAPRNTGRPTVEGVARVGQELTAGEGTWTGSPSSFRFQWQRCDVDAATCFDVAGATGRTYGVRLADLGFRLRVAVTARNSDGAATATSGLTAVVTPTAAITNRRPTLRIISVRFLGSRVYARVRICDDSPRNLRIIQTDARPRMRPATRRFSTRVAPRPCGAYTRNWVPARRFRGPGRYTVILRARDVSGMTSAPVRRTFNRR
jgi:hypothetical protein